MASLTVHAEGCEQKYVLENPAVTVGRGLESDIRVKDIKASRRHCQIVKTPQGYQCLDLSSGNGTWLNGVQIKQQALAEGDKIQVGSTTITFHDGSAAAPPADKPAVVKAAPAVEPAAAGKVEAPPSPAAPTRKITAKVAPVPPAAALPPAGDGAVAEAAEEAPAPPKKGTLDPAKAATQPVGKPALGAKPRRGLGARAGGRPAAGAARSKTEGAVPTKKKSPLILVIIAVAALAIAAGAYFLLAKGGKEAPAKGGGSGKARVESPAGPGNGADPKSPAARPGEPKTPEEKPSEPKK